MAYPRARSMNEDLHDGMTDGGWKKIAVNRGGEVDPLTYQTRRDLSDCWYGFHEAREKVLATGGTCVTPTFQDNKEAEPDF